MDYFFAGIKTKKVTFEVEIVKYEKGKIKDIDKEKKDIIEINDNIKDKFPWIISDIGDWVVNDL